MRLIFFLLLAAISIPVLAFLAVFSGAESAPLCGDRPVVVSGAGAAAFQAGITRMGADVARGRAATATFDESQVSQWLRFLATEKSTPAIPEIPQANSIDQVTKSMIQQHRHDFTRPPDVSEQANETAFH